MKTINLTQGFITVVDDEDFETAFALNWRLIRKGNNLYAGRTVPKTSGLGRTTLYLHRFLNPGIPEIDHRDGNGLNNRRENLRSCTQRQNTCGFQHKRKGASSRFRGVSWDSDRSKWFAKIEVGDRQIALGRFDQEVEAARAYDNAAKEHFGAFASPNFP